MKILVIDNYDSFTYNLVHYMEKVTNDKVEVYRNNEITLQDVNQFDKILLSPGPGVPSEAGILIELIKTYASSKNIFGICLGQQAIVQALGGSLINLDEVYHGISTPIEIIKDDLLFANIPREINVGRYHSWVVNREDLPSDIEITAVDLQGQIMAISHRKYNIKAVQFHPESILTEYGLEMIRNWVNS
jgi:anthranilate synthase component II